MITKACFGSTGVYDASFGLSRCIDEVDSGQSMSGDSKARQLWLPLIPFNRCG